MQTGLPATPQQIAAALDQHQVDLIDALLVEFKAAAEVLDRVVELEARAG
jgi:hypothetical protein